MHICCIIKPPSVGWYTNICEELHREGINIIAQKEFAYTASAIAVLYDHMSTDAQTFIGLRYSATPGISLLLDFHSTEHCLEVIGHVSDPRMCKPGTLRAQYGTHLAPEVVGQWQWFESAVHRPVDERERVRDVRLVFPELLLDAGT